jgi:hypothetical protein
MTEPTRIARAQTGGQTWDRLMTSAPINKAASVVTNQHACADSVALNRMIDERRILKANIKAWAAEILTCGVKRRKELRPILRQANKRFQELCIVMKSNPDLRAASRYGTFNDAFVACAREMLPPQVVNEISGRANEVMKL